MQPHLTNLIPRSACQSKNQTGPPAGGLPPTSCVSSPCRTGSPYSGARDCWPTKALVHKDTRKETPQTGLTYARALSTQAFPQSVNGSKIVPAAASHCVGGTPAIGPPHDRQHKQTQHHHHQQKAPPLSARPLQIARPLQLLHSPAGVVQSALHGALDGGHELALLLDHDGQVAEDLVDLAHLRLDALDAPEPLLGDRPLHGRVVGKNEVILVVTVVLIKVVSLGRAHLLIEVGGGGGGRWVLPAGLHLPRLAGAA
mmetsp:Transcript_52273/g.131383  ORF Transcript_52273/g.131383 Transcript_52273/m.131383 type:complete len:256 (+) Transcript_52273:422-1189(+)